MSETMIETELKLSRTAAARAVLKAKLGGKSSLERGREREEMALDWIYRWGWSSATTLEALVGSGKSGLARRLVKNGLLVSTKTISRRSEKYLPSAFLTLTEEGKRVTERTRADLIQYDMRPERVNQNLLAHDEMAQRTTAERLYSGEIKGFLSEHEMAQKSEKGVKSPDVVWIFPDGLKVSVEIELSPKWERDLDVFVRSTLISLVNKEGGARFDHMVLVTDNKAIFERYQKAFAPGATYSIWAKNAVGRWAITEQKKVPAWAEGKISWKLLKNS